MIDRLRGNEGGWWSIGRAMVPDVIRKRFTLKFALILAVMGITVGLIGATATGAVSSQVEQNVEQEYSDLAAQKANVIEEWVQRNSQAVQLTSKNDVLARSGGATPFAIRQELATTEGNLYGVQAIYLVNRTSDQTTIVASPQFPFDTNVSKTSRMWLNDISFYGMGVAEVRITDVHDAGGTPVVAFISPVQGTEDRYLVIEHDVRQLADTLQQGEQSSRFTQVVNTFGRIQTASRSAEIGQQYGDQEAMEPIRRASDLDEGHESGVIARTGPNDGVLDEEYTVGYAPVRVQNAELDWIVLVHEPTRDVFGFVNTVSTWGFLSTLGGMVLIIMLGTAIGYSTTRDINQLRRLAERMREGDLEIEVSSPRIDSIGQLYDGFDAMRGSLKSQIEAAERARKEAEVSRAEAMEMNRYLQSTAEQYSQIMRRCADGDLTQRFETGGQNEAMDRIATEFNEMIEELELTTGQLKRFAADVEDAGVVLQSSSESVRVSSEHVADSVATISADAHDQKERLETVAAELDEVVDRLVAYDEAHDDIDLEEQLDRFEEIAAMVSDVASISQKTLAESELVAGAAEEQAAEINEVSQRAEELTQYARPLRSVLDEFDIETDPAEDDVLATDGEE
jgi:methyl-accepting chemotaxis protein